MAIQTKRPTAKVQGKQGMKSAQDYLAQLDELLKRNTGTGTHIGQDTSSNIPMYLPGRVADPTGLGQAAPSIAKYGDGMTAPAPVDRSAPMSVQQPEQTASIDEFLDAFNESYSAPENQPTYGTPEVNFIASTPDGGNLMSDGTIVYDDGTIRVGDPDAFAIASQADGSIRYSDDSYRKPAPQGIASLAGDRESILYDDGSKRWGQYLYGEGDPVSTEGGLRGLVRGIFGKDQTITQEYGNYNPNLEPGSGYNYGTDIRTRDLGEGQRVYKLPVGATVVKVLKDDGSRWGDISGHQGYGNSLLLRLATGEMVRFSHMNSILDVKEGDTINPGEVFGTPGTTGNTAGEHLDLEYYNAQGQLSNPAQFSGFSDPQGLREPLPGQPAPGTLVQSAQQSTQQPAQSQATQQPIAQPQQAQQPVDTRPVVAQAASNVFKNVAEVPSKVAPQIASGINTLNPTGEAGLGITETLQGRPEAAREEQAKTIESVGTALKAPELQTGELSREQGTNPFRQLAGNLVDTASTPLKKIGVPDFGISEAIAGGKTVNTDANLAPGASASDGLYSKNKTPDDYASVLGGNVKDALSQAGEGVKSFGKSSLGALENVFKPKQPIEQRSVGSIAGADAGSLAGTSDSVETPGKYSSLMDTTQSMQSLGKNDIRDPFFKSGESESYIDYLKPDAENLAGGALTLDLFNPDFFLYKESVGDVFGDTAMAGEATEKSNEAIRVEIERLEAKRRAKIEEMKRKPGESIRGWMARTGRQSELDAIGRNPRLHLDDNSGRITEVGQPGHPSSKSSSSSGPSPMKPGESTVEWMKRTGQQSTIDAYGGPQNLNTYFGNSTPKVSSVRTYQSQTGFGVPLMIQNNHTAYSGPGKNLRIDSDNWITPADNRDAMVGDQPINFDAPTKTPSASLNNGGQIYKSNLFSRGKEFLNNIFRR